MLKPAGSLLSKSNSRNAGAAKSMNPPRRAVEPSASLPLLAARFSGISRKPCRIPVRREDRRQLVIADDLGKSVPSAQFSARDDPKIV